jgi:hypothetical protein
MKKVKQILVLLMLCIVGCLLFACAGESNNKTEKINYASKELSPPVIEGGAFSPGNFWHATYYSSTSEFDIGDVTLRFGIWGKFSDEGPEALTLPQYDFRVFPIVKIYFRSERNAVLYDMIEVATIERETLEAGQYWSQDPYYMTLTIPAKAFLFDDGVIGFCYSAELHEEGKFEQLTQATLWYKKINGKIVLSNSVWDDEEEMDNRVRDGFRVVKDPSVIDYAAFHARTPDLYNNNVKIDFYFGSVFNGREFEYVDLYFVTGYKGTGEKEFVKRISDYNEEEYTVDRVLDYYGDVASISYRHMEEIRVPQKLFTKSEDVINLFVYGKEVGKEVKLLAVIPFLYSYVFPNNFSDEYPYNRLCINENSYNPYEYREILETVE